MATKADSSPEPGNRENSNTQGGKTCPKCGTLMGQKNICPVCSNRKEATPGEPATEGSARAVAPMDRFWQYQQLKKTLGDNPKDFAFVLRTVRTIQRDYADYFHFDYVSFYTEMYEAKCPFAVFAALMDPEWNATFRKIMKCGWKSDDAFLLSHPLLWSPVLLADGNHYFVCDNQGGYDTQRKNALASIRTGGEDDQKYGSLGVFFHYTFPFSLSIWGENYEDMRDNTVHFCNPRKPIKLVSLYGAPYGGWQEMVPHGKRVLILHCGTALEIKDADQEQTPPRPQVDAESPAPEGADDQPAERVYSNLSYVAAGEKLRTFETYDGLQFLQNTKTTSGAAVDHTLLYIVEP